MNGIYRLEFKVRDYECDMQGIVNNSVYQNYLEHARHEYLLENRIDFAKLTFDEIHLVVVRCELDYKKTLRSGDWFYVTIESKMNGRVRFDFYQNIYRKSDDVLVLKAKVTGAAMKDNGRPCIPEQIQGLFKET